MRALLRVAAVLLVTSACSSKSQDPVGTIDVAVRFESQGPNILDFESGDVVAGSAADTCSPSTALALFDLGLDTAGTFHACPLSIADLGRVAGLGSITEYPASGFASTAAAVVGEGYVVRSAERYVFAVYVVSQILSVDDGSVIGVNLKWVRLPCNAADSALYCAGEIANASGAACSSGACTYSSCNAGYLDCDGDPTNGCEASDNCSPVQNAATTFSCANGCTYTDCNAGFFDCDGDRSNGCEVSQAIECAGVLNATATTYSCAAGCGYVSCAAGTSDCDGNAANGCEYMGALCPVVFDEGSDEFGYQPEGIAAGAGRVFVVEQYSVREVPLDGGVPISFGGPYSGLFPNYTPVLAVDSANVYYVEDGALLSQPVDGGPPTTLVTADNVAVSPATLEGIAVNGNSAYWTVTSSDGGVRGVSLDGGAPVTVASGQFAPLTIAVNADNAYWINGGDGTSANLTMLEMAPLDGGAAVTLLAGTVQPDNLVLDSTRVYFSSGTAVMSMLLDGGSLATLASARTSDNISSIAIDLSNVYWTEGPAVEVGNNDTAGWVMETPLDGGTPVTLASGQSNPTSLVVDATSLYWISGLNVMRGTPK